MTVSSPTTYPEPYDCNGVLTDFDFHFGVSESSEVEVILTSSDGTETDITSSCTFSATNDDFSSGGTVTAPEAYASGNTITLRMAIPVTQESEFTEEMDTLYELFEDGLDKLTRIAQQLEEAIGRALSFTETSGLSGAGLLPAPETDKYLAWDEEGKLTNREFVVLGDLSAHVADAQAHRSASAQAVTIASGVLALTSYTAKDFFAVSAETGTTDDLTQITGLSYGDQIILSATSGQSITIKAGTSIKMTSDFILNSVYDRICLQCIGSDMMVQLYRSSNA